VCHIEGTAAHRGRIKAFPGSPAHRQHAENDPITGRLASTPGIAKDILGFTNSLNNLTMNRRIASEPAQQAIRCEEPRVGGVGAREVAFAEAV
jgi:hypothetical protein